LDKKKEEFLAKLKEIFRVEAAEHNEALTAGLIALEHAKDSEYASIVEGVFREVHSLKGAARAVFLPGIEALCFDLESIFAAMKREKFKLSTEMLDAIHPALGVLSTMCANPNAPSTMEIRGKEQEALWALKRIVRVIADKRTGTTESAVFAVEPPVVGTQTVPARSTPEGPFESPETRNSTAVSVSETIRISSQKINVLLLETEELVGAKIAESERASELRMLVMELADWNQRRVRQHVRQRFQQDDTMAASELLESEILYTRKLESSLRKLAGSAHQDARSLAAITDKLLMDTKQVLLLPCSYLLGQLPKVVRDLAREQGKEVDLLVKGEDIEIDRRVLDELKDPLIHLLRNCIDHGIEKPDLRRKIGKPSHGSITITVKTTEGNRVEITLGDDGAGIDVGKVKKAAVRLGLIAADEMARQTEAEVMGLIFRSGLSTSPIITDLSGRGLGMAIVQEKVEKLGGTITVASTPGAGTTFRMLVPLSMATFRGVLVGVANQYFVIPTANVVRTSRVKPQEIKTVENRLTIMLGERAVSLVRLRDVLEITGPDEREKGGVRPIVVVRASDIQVALLVDEVKGEMEVVVKGLGRQLVRVRNISGACISGGGAVIPILNVADLVESAGTAGMQEPMVTARDKEPKRPGRLLLAEDSITARTLLKSILEAVGYEVMVSVDGLDALTKLKMEPFDLVVSDVDMPRMNGFELTTNIRSDKKLGELPVVLVTSLGSQEDREYGIKVGANAYIVKSDFDQNNLLEIIQRLL
jgi:two-component system chemotaxis sensor kinase CheA